MATAGFADDDEQDALERMAHIGSDEYAAEDQDDLDDSCFELDEDDEDLDDGDDLDEDDVEEEARAFYEEHAR